MSYRIKERPKHEPRRTFENVSTLSTIFIENGTIEHIAIPCWYVEVRPPRKAHCHSRQHHDHVGWPSPRHPDHICQAWDLAHSCCSFDRHKHHCDHCRHYLDMDSMIPIHLLKEGYKKIDVSLKDQISGLSASGVIDDSRDILGKDYKNDWIVRLTFEAKCKDAISEPKETVFAVFASGTLKGGRNVKDMVAKGKIRIMPGPYAS